MKKRVFTLLLSLFLLCGCGSNHDHAYTAELIRVPTCTEEGLLRYSCVCGDSYTSPVTALGHDYVTIPELPPTCTEPGRQAYTYCTREEAPIALEIPPTGHRFVDGVCSVCGAEITLWSGEADTAWYLEAKSSFTLTRAEELAGLAVLVDAGISFAGKTVVLGADLYLNDVSQAEYWEFLPPQNVWEPIGGNGMPFCGSFRGDGHTIFGLYVRGGDSIGLFGAIEDATVADFKLASAYVAGANRVGIIGQATRSTVGYITATDLRLNGTERYTGFAAYCDGGTLAHVSVRGELRGGTSGTGGIAGYCSGTLEACEFVGTVASAEPEKTGCIVGYLYYGVLRACTADGLLCGFNQGGTIESA